MDPVVPMGFGLLFLSDSNQGGEHARTPTALGWRVVSFSGMRKMYKNVEEKRSKERSVMMRKMESKKFDTQAKEKYCDGNEKENFMKSKSEKLTRNARRKNDDERKTTNMGMRNQIFTE